MKNLTKNRGGVNTYPSIDLTNCNISISKIYDKAFVVFKDKNIPDYIYCENLGYISKDGNKEYVSTQNITKEFINESVRYKIDIPNKNMIGFLHNSLIVFNKPMDVAPYQRITEFKIDIVNRICIASGHGFENKKTFPCVIDGNTITIDNVDVA